MRPSTQSLSGRFPGRSWRYISAILPRSSKYVLVIVVVATLSTPPSVVVSSSSKHVPTVHPAQLNILGCFAWLCGLPRTLLLRGWVNSASPRPDKPGPPAGGCPYHRVLCARPAGESEGVLRRLGWGEAKGRAKGERKARPRAL